MVWDSGNRRNGDRSGYSGWLRGGCVTCRRNRSRRLNVSISVLPLNVKPRTTIQFRRVKHGLWRLEFDDLLSICLVVETIAKKVPEIAECTLKSVRNRLLLAFVECCTFRFGVFEGPVSDILMRCTALGESDAYESRYTN